MKVKGINPINSRVLKVFKNKILQSLPLLFCSENSCLNTSLTEEVTNHIGDPNTFSDREKYPAEVLPNTLFINTFGDVEANTDKLSENREYFRKDIYLIINFLKFPLVNLILNLKSRLDNNRTVLNEYPLR